MSEIGIIIAVQRFFLASTPGEWTAIALARVWIFLFLPLLVAVRLRSRKEKHATGEALWSAGLAMLIGEVLSLAIMRVRPFLDAAQVVAVIPSPLTSSFPSIHTATAVAITAALFFGNHKAGWLGLLITFGVVLGRIAVGVHYPSDILGGAAVGLLAFLFVRAGHQAIRKRKNI